MKSRYTWDKMCFICVWFLILLFISSQVDLGTMFTWQLCLTTQTRENTPKHWSLKRALHVSRWNYYCLPYSSLSTMRIKEDNGYKMCHLINNESSLWLANYDQNHVRNRELLFLSNINNCSIKIKVSESKWASNGRIKCRTLLETYRWSW